MADLEQLRQIVYKVLDGSASNDERAILNQYLETVDRSTAITNLLPLNGEQQDTERDLSATEQREMLAGILQQERGRVVPLPQRKRRRTWVAAASIAAVLGIGALGYRLVVTSNTAAHQLAGAYKEQVSKFGETGVVVLPDGSHVQLNAGSRLRYPEQFTDSTRQVYLEGEAFFEVAHDSAHPFIVHAGAIATRVLGTSFNIRSYADEADKIVSVKTGKVKVSIEQVPSTAQITETILTKARQAVYHTGSTEGIMAGDIPLEEVAAWSGNRLVYNNKPLGYILHELERVYNIHFQVQQPQVLTTNYTARLNKGELSNTLNDLSLLANIGFTQQDSLIKVTAR